MLWVTRAGGNVDRVACPWLISAAARNGANGAGAHTMALDSRRHRLYVLLPRTYRAAVFVDE